VEIYKPRESKFKRVRAMNVSVWIERLQRPWSQSRTATRRKGKKRRGRGSISAKQLTYHVLGSTAV